MIGIDFQGGAHGNFLEFVCNVMADVKTDGDPFNNAGASHTKRYLSPKLFYANHYSFTDAPLISNRVIAIKVGIDDLLPLSQISLLRAGDYGYDNNKLEVNTYNKLNNSDYKWMLKTILDAFFTTQVENSYNAVKDPTWPDVKTVEDFYRLPEHIRKECIEIHNLELLELTEDQPDCPRHILREFFQIGFATPNIQGFMARQELMKYPEQTDVYTFPFDAFYNTTKFLDQIELIASWADIKYTSQQRVLELHTQFLEKQIYKDSKIKCDQIVEQLIENKIEPPNINLIEEAYVNAMLERHGYECRY